MISYSCSVKKLFRGKSYSSVRQVLSRTVHFLFLETPLRLCLQMVLFFYGILKIIHIDRVALHIEN